MHCPYASFHDRLSRTALVIVAALAALAPAPLASQADTVRLMLRYDHQYQFAGYYVAQWEGLYRDLGLHVEILPGVAPDGSMIEVGPNLASGEIEFGVMGSEALIHLARTDDIVLLAPIFQRSPVAAFFHADLPVQRPSDLARYRIGEAQSPTATAEAVAMITADGVPPWNLQLLPTGGEGPVIDYVDRFLRGDFDVLLGYDMSVPWLAARANIPIESLDPDDWGLGFYGDALFANAEYVEEHPELTEAFVAATLEGWRRALEDGEATAIRIAQELPRTIPESSLEAYNLFLVPKVQELILAPLIPVGSNDPARWDQMSSVLAAAGILPAPVDIRTHFFDPAGDRERQAAARRRTFERAGMLLLFLLGITALALFVRTRQERTHRMALELALQRSARLESLGRLAGGIAHDFNNLLTVVRGHAELIRSAPGPRDEVAEHGWQILEATRRAEALIRQLLVFARRQDLEPRKVDVSELVTDLEPMLRRLIPERIGVHTKLAPGAVVEADPGRLEQVLTNLVVNAADAISGAGEIRVTVERVQLSGGPLQRLPDGMAPGEYVRIRVTDTGHGIPPDVQERIFEPFFTTRAMGSGTGLGLATVHGIVTQSGGRITVRSDASEGTEFTVLLPASEGAAAATDRAAKSPAPPPPEPECAGVVLLVEDDAAVRRVTRTVLTRSDLEVLEAEDGRKALDIAAREGQRIDLVVTDVVMPGMDGPTLVNHLRSMDPTLPVIVMSGYSDHEFAELVGDGRTRYLSKPHSPAELLETVRTLIRERRPRRDSEADESHAPT